MMLTGALKLRGQKEILGKAKDKRGLRYVPLGCFSLRHFLKMAEVRAVFALRPVMLSWKKEWVSEREPTNPMDTTRKA